MGVKSLSKRCPSKTKGVPGWGRGRTGGAKASRSGSLSSSFRLFLLLHLHPVLLCASRIVLTFSLAPCCLACLFPPKTLRRPGPPPRPPEDWVRSGAPARPHTQASLSAASNLPSKKGISAKGAAPASALPRPGARRAIKRQPWPPGLWPPRLAATAPGLRCARTRAPPPTAAGDAEPAASPRHAPFTCVSRPRSYPDSARRRGALRQDRRRRRSRVPAGSRESQHAGPARSRLPPVAPGPPAVAGCRGPGHSPG